MTLLPTVREQMEQAAMRRARPRRSVPAPGRMLVPAAALAAIVALAVLLSGWGSSTEQRRALGYSLPVSAASVFTPATPQRLREATDLQLSSPRALAALAQPDPPPRPTDR
jgi:hypothetical protein